MTALTLDLGNSALKLASWRGAEPSFARAEWSANWQQTLGAELRSFGEPGPGQLAIACVVAEALREEVVQLCREYSPTVNVNPVAALDIDCEEQHSIGRDRLYAATGAWDLDPRPALVLDAGSALTVDALGAGPTRGCFMGGAIAPGPALLARALGEAAAQLFEVELEGHVPALGRNTRGALRSGIRVGFRGAAAELVRRIGAEAGLQGSRIWLTGGASAWLLDDPRSDEPLFGEREVVVDPWLVHRGLLASLAPKL